MGPFTSGFSILVLPISLQLRMHMSEANKNVESYKHMWYFFVQSFFSHLTMPFPVHRLHNNEWKDNPVSVCVCVFMCVCLFIYMRVCVCVCVLNSEWNCDNRHCLKRLKEKKKMRVRAENQNVPHANESTDCPVARAGACPNHSLTASLCFRIIIHYEQ